MRFTQMRFTAVYMKVPEGYVAFVEELPGANTQGETLEEARANLAEAVTMVLEANRELSEQSLAEQSPEAGEVIRESLVVPAAPCLHPTPSSVLGFTPLAGIPFFRHSSPASSPSEPPCPPPRGCGRRRSARVACGR